jgi:hypothetical protein
VFASLSDSRGGMQLHGPQRNALCGLGLLALGSVLSGSLPPEIAPSDLVLLALACWRTR